MFINASLFKTPQFITYITVILQLEWDGRSNSITGWSWVNVPTKGCFLAQTNISWRKLEYSHLIKRGIYSVNILENLRQTDRQTESFMTLKSFNTGEYFNDTTRQNRKLCLFFHSNIYFVFLMFALFIYLQVGIKNWNKKDCLSNTLED